MQALTHPEALSEVEIRQEARFVLWALFAAASTARPWAGPHAPGVQDINTRAEREADALLASAVQRFPFLASEASP